MNQSATAGQEQKTPGLINWTSYLAITCLVVIPLAVLTVRSGAWQQGLLLYAVACLGSTLLIIGSILLLMLPRFASWRSTLIKRALLPALPGTLLLMSLTTGGDYPRIHDITTDTSDPPVFLKAEEVRGETANTLAIKPDVISQQQQAYPDLKSLRSPLSIDDAFTQALTVSRGMGWEIYSEDRSKGIIEAVDTTKIMLFKDDIVIRVKGDAQGAIIDLRSVSRVGESDLGANAKRIRAFQDAFKQG
jgi:uncharacterized protein (DUF1499 family)